MIFGWSAVHKSIAILEPTPPFTYCMVDYFGPFIIREFKQITTAGATTAAVTEKVLGECISVVWQILSLASKAKYKEERNFG